MTTRRILQVASFAGNQGDNANSAGTRSLFRATFSDELEFHDLEIRGYFRGRKKFDDEFVSLCNGYDLVMIGGGNYFELWLEESCSGTTVDITPDRLAAIRPPILFHALGFDDGMGTPARALSNARSWFAWVAARPKQLRVTLRNDGSLATAQQLLGPELTRDFVGIPDGGFLLPDPGPSGLPRTQGRRIGINLAGDMGDIRFGAFPGGLPGFLAEFASFLTELVASDAFLELTFFPHIHRDMLPISLLLEMLPDPVVRSRLRVAPFVTGPGTEAAFFAHYADCDLILGNRFHANVVPLGLGIPTLGLVNYPQVSKLYSELGATERMHDIATPGFAVALRNATLAILSDLEADRRRVAGIRDAMLAQAQHAMLGTAHWLGWPLQKKTNP